MIGANIYFVKAGIENYTDFTVKWKGLRILKMDGFLAQGEPKNIYTASWINSNKEDVFVPDKVCYENPDVEISFIIDDSHDSTVDVRAVHKNFISYMTSHQVTIKSEYAGAESKFVCLDSYEPTTIIVNRPTGRNYIMGTLKMHRVDENTYL